MFSTIKLCKLIEEKTVIESSELFEKSAFKFVYQKTKSLIEKIVSKEDANISELQEDQSIQELQIDNIISFEGRRGTGKTSVMTSVCKALKKNKQTKFIKKQDSREPEFIVLDFIDASMLETGEDILDIILANMFLKLKGVVSECDSYNRGYHHEIEYEVRELYKLFDEIYDNLRKSKNMERYKNTGSPLNSLNNLSNSQILKIKIFKLIQVYLKYMETQKYVGQKAFLVISVDDLDMYFQTKDSSPFEVLETLHRYFMIPGVIILLTYNYQDLSIGCQKHFYQNYHDAIITGKNIEEIEKSVQKWTEQYLKKVLPIQTRIYMPSLKKSDYDDENNIKIELTKKELDKLLEDCDNAEIILKKEEFQEDKILFSTKRFALILKVSVANLYYDAVGQKKHFIEPTTIRELAQSYMVVRQLQSMYKKIEYEATTDEAENMLFKELLDDIYFRYAKVKLSDEEEQRFSNYLDVPIERRTKDILRDIEDFVNKENSTIDITISEIVGESLRKEKYSYGELLYYLYKARRAGIFSKELVCCILDSYTVVLTKFYRRLKEGNKEYREQMLNVMGSSIVSSWSNLLIPKVNGRVQENGDKSSDLPNSNYVVESYFIKSVGAKKFSHKTIKWDFVLSENCKDHFQLQMLEILLMFFTGVYHENNEGLISGFKIEYFSGEIKKKVNEQNEKNYQKEAHFSIEFSDACFNVMNFVNNLFLGEKYFEKVRESMKNAYVAYFKDIEKKEILKKGNDTKDAETKYLINLLKTDAENAKKVEQFLKDNSLYKKYNSWFEKTCGLAMPVYSFDMMYNIMKRKYQNMSIRNDDIYYKVFWKALDKFYLEVGQLLKQQDKRYFNELNTPFYDAYIESPFIDYIELLRNNEEWNEKFSKMILAVAEMPSSTDYNAE